MAADAETSEDAALGGRLVLRQPKRGHRFGHDAILLAAAADARPGDMAVDLGAGVGTAGLALACRVPKLNVVLVEVDPMLASLARENAARNALADRVQVAALDVNAGAQDFARAGLPGECAQHVLMNPPFNDPVRQNASPDAGRRHAHVASSGTLAHWIGRAAWLLAPSGTLTMIWRADGLADVLATLNAQFGGLAILPVYPRPDAAAIRILVRATKQAGAPLALLPGLTLNDADGTPSTEAEAILRGGQSLKAFARR
jgi:tRNA1(Val) A37 N6-methylase TrmN6